MRKELANTPLRNVCNNVTPKHAAQTNVEIHPARTNLSTHLQTVTITSGAFEKLDFSDRKTTSSVQITKAEMSHRIYIDASLGRMRAKLLVTSSALGPFKMRRHE